MSEVQELLRQFVAHRSREALEELIQRHLALVYSAAFRQVRDAHLAEDVTQAVFLALTQKAGTIRNGVALGGWLLSVTHCTSVNVMKKQALQKKHERLAAKSEMQSGAADAWGRIEPVLDEELHQLPPADRDALVLRFFQERSFAEIAHELNISEKTARLRVTGALERLRARIAGRRKSLNTRALSRAVGAFAVHPAPLHLLARTIAERIGSPAPHCLSLAQGALHMNAYSRARLLGTLAASLVLCAAAALIMFRTGAPHPAPALPTPATPQAEFSTAPNGTLVLNMDAPTAADIASSEVRPDDALDPLNNLGAVFLVTRDGSSPPPPPVDSGAPQGPMPGPMFAGVMNPNPQVAANRAAPLAPPAPVAAPSVAQSK